MENWLDDQRAYQEQAYGVDFAEMRRKNETVDYVATMLTAAQIEIAEAFQEVPWKPWAQLTAGQRGEILAQRESKVIGELVDVLFFVANALVAVGCTDERLHEAYAAKMAVNVSRQETGYDGVSDKCPVCGRALDEPGATPFKAENGVTYCDRPCAATDETKCAKCGYEWGPFELYAVGLDHRRYCSSRHAIDAAGGQLEID